MAKRPETNAAASSGATRRTPDEVRRLLLESARALFAEKGYAGTSTREIAARAGVSETLLFRHFGVKAKLFERAVLDPINEFVHRYVEEWKSRPIEDHTAEAVAYAYVEGFFRLLTEHRQLVLALIAAGAFESMPELIAASPLSQLMDELELVATREAEARGYAPFDVTYVGETDGIDPAGEAATLATYAEAGVTWWLENVQDQRGTPPQMRQRIRQGPPRM